MRIFFGIEIDKEIKNNLINFRDSLSINDRSVKWVKKENLHLTLQFIGEVDSNKANELINLTSEISFKQFEVEFACVGGFPHLGNPRIIWIGVNKGTDELKNLQKIIQKTSLKISNEIDTKPYHPHITMARIKSRLSKNYFNDINEKKDKFFGLQKINNFSLFSSDLKSNGPIYKVLYCHQLK